MKKMALLAAIVLLGGLALACDQTPDISAPDAVPVEEDLVFNACASRLWDGLDWEGGDGNFRLVAWGISIGNYCIWRMDRGLEPVDREIIEAMRNEHDWAKNPPRGR